MVMKKIWEVIKKIGVQIIERRGEPAIMFSLLFKLKPEWSVNSI